MNERVKFIARYLQKDEPFNALCEHAGVSRKTGCKWLERYDAGGVAALIDRSRAPQSHPHAVGAEIVELILAARRRHRAGGRGSCSWYSNASSPRAPGRWRAPSVTSSANTGSFVGGAAAAVARRTASASPTMQRRTRSGVRISKATSRLVRRAVIR
jgi:hypothetical protein